MRKLHLFLVLVLFVIIQWISIQVFTPISRDWTYSQLFQATKNDEDNVVLIYNRIPKTASTTFMHLPYELCDQNGKHLDKNVTTKGVLFLGFKPDFQGIILKPCRQFFDTYSI